MSLGRNTLLEDSNKERKDSWDDVLPRLHNDDHRERNWGLNMLLSRLSPDSDLRLFETNEKLYREGVNLTLERVDDENYTVRVFAVAILEVVLETVKDKEEYEDLHQRVFTEVVEAMTDEELWVSGRAMSVIENQLEDMEEGRKKEEIKEKINQAKILRKKRLLISKSLGEH
jgi:hypothetical protein